MAGSEDRITQHAEAQGPVRGSIGGILVGSLSMGSITRLGLALAVMAGTLGAPSGAWAQREQTRDQSKETTASEEDFQFARRLSRVFRSVATNTEPAVVHITQLRRVRSVDWFGRPVGDQRIVPAGVGSGVVVDSDGYVVTNNHVIANANELTVKMSDGREFKASVVGADAATDLAVVKIDATTFADGTKNKDGAGLRFQTADWADSNEVEVGEWVIAIGSPFGLDNSVTQGIISAKGRTVSTRETGMSYEDYIQTDAAINPGNSGGPLLNLEGRIVGINSAIASRSGGYDGLGFAIPSNVARAVYDNIRANGRVLRGWLGVQWDARDATLSDQQVVVSSVMDNSPAAEAGLRAGDVITKVQGSAATPQRFARTLALAGPGTKVDLEVMREGQPMTIAATLGDFANAQRQIWKAQGLEYVDRFDIVVSTLTPQKAQSMNYPARTRGVLIESIENQSVAAQVLRPRDIIVSINDEPVTEAGEVLEIVKSIEANGATRFNIIRDGMRGYVDVQP
jgi:serine protease Do